MVENHDFLPTVLDYLGLKNKTPESPPLPGHSFSPALQGQAMDWDNVIYHEFENTRMLRTPRWKLTLRHPFGPDELYDMQNDPDERENLFYAAVHAAVRNELKQKLTAYFARYADSKYDRWNGGRTKGNQILKEN